jgi:hypothetical protein
MIRIGFIRWLVQVSKTSVGKGQTKLACSLTPQASRYKSVVKVWHGLRSEHIERETSVDAQDCSRVEDTYSTNGLKQAAIMKSLAEELASRTVNYCVNIGIVDFSGFDLCAAIYLVRTAIMNAVCSDISDIIERVEFIDLVPDMQAVRLERDRARVENEARRQAAWNIHNAEDVERQKHRNKASNLSFELLYSMLNSTEKKEAETTGKVTVKTLAGNFVVPITGHGMVMQYVDGKYVVSHCVVFQDYSIPVGDEVLMKIALLKTDPQRFMRVSNKFIQNPRFALYA